MKLERLHHIQLAMPEGREDDARAFYQGLLGLPEMAKPPNLVARGGVWFERDDLRVHLGVERPFSPARKAHPAFLVTGLDDLIERLADAGYQPIEDEPLAGFHRVYVSDPFGNRIELMEVAVEGKDETQQLRAVRELYAKTMAVYGRSFAEPIERAFTSVRREAFLPPGPWKIFLRKADGHTYLETPSADPIHLYQDVLIALDEDQGVNNGQPSLHAAWLGAAAPAPGETVVHIGAGLGYYTAILSTLVGSVGHVTAFEISDTLGAAAVRHLGPFGNVSVRIADATESTLPDADVIYVNAGVKAPPLSWLQALRPGGRLIFPWRPSEELGIAALITRQPGGFEARMRAPAWFIPCIGAMDPATLGPIPDWSGVRRIQSLYLTSEQEPDDTAVAVYPNLWFSSQAVVDEANH
ncbi:MAG: VOC family protein [Pseudomonadota bacterium]